MYIILNVLRFIRWNECMRITTNTTEHKDTKAWEMGFKAGHEGKPVTLCPHASGSIQEKSWRQGYTDGLQKMKDS